MEKRIKILFTIPNFDTAGSGKVVCDLVKGLDKANFEPEICCFHNRGEYFKVIETLGVKVHLFPFSTSYRPFISFPLRVFKIYKFFKSNQFDIIHSWHWSSDISEPLAVKLAGIPFIYTKKAMGWGNKAWSWRSRLSSHIIAINTDMTTLFFKDMVHKTSYIPLGVDTEYFKPLEKTYTCPEGLTFSVSDFVIVSVANLVPIKGIELLLEAVKQIGDSSIKVVIVGDAQSAYGMELKASYAKTSTFFVGKQLDVRPYLALADVFVIPTLSLGEGLPIAPLEAMSSGRIVIGSDVPGVRDILKAFSHYKFKPNDTIDLVNKILKIKNMSDIERKKNEIAMCSYVNRELSIYKFINSHEVLYHKIYTNS